MMNTRDNFCQKWMSTRIKPFAWSLKWASLRSKCVLINTLFTSKMNGTRPLLTVFLKDTVERLKKQVDYCTSGSRPHSSLIYYNVASHATHCVPTPHWPSSHVCIDEHWPTVTWVQTSSVPGSEWKLVSDLMAAGDVLLTSLPPKHKTHVTYWTIFLLNIQYRTTIRS